MWDKLGPLFGGEEGSSSYSPLKIMTIPDEKNKDTVEERVFGNRSLLKRILSYAIVDIKTGKISRPYVKTLRLVQKRWLDEITTSIANSDEPLFQFSLTKANSLWKSPYVQQNGKLLDQYIKAMKSRRVIPPFSLHLHPDFMRRENYKSFLDCMTSSCGSSLVSLHLSFPMNPTMIFNFPPFALPNLKRLSIQFSAERIADLENFSRSCATTNIAVFFIQAILTSSPNLKVLRFATDVSKITDYPYGFETLRLPPSLTSIEVTCPPLVITDWKFLVNNCLPKLSHLTLSVGMGTSLPHPDKDCKVLHQIFRNLQNLSTVELATSRRQTASKTKFLLFSDKQVQVRFPLMRRLTRLKVTGTTWKLLNLQNSLPILETLFILDQSEDLFWQWTDSEYPSVKTLIISLVSDDKHPVPLPFTVERMQRLHFSFHNVTYLKITLSGDEDMVGEGLKYLFSAMTSLERLSITVKGSNAQMSSDDWDGLIIGAPKEMVRALRQSPDYWNSFLLTDHDDRFPSLRKLTKLNSLYLNDQLSGDSSSLEPLITDVAFHFAFLRMPALRSLYLTGQFNASDEMKKAWKKKIHPSVIS